jgi:thimet oligopeptidase
MCAIFEIFDAASGKYLANIYVDLYARDGKRGGAFAFNTRRASALAGRKPQSVLVTNFSREGLNHRQFETLLHEFGHVLHGVLSTADYVSQAGTRSKRDFVEAPSQMFEEWVRREQSLALFKKVCAECPALPREEIGRLEGARKFGRGIAVSRQAAYARLDMELSKEAQPVMPLWKRLEEAAPARAPRGHVQAGQLPAPRGRLRGGLLRLHVVARDRHRHAVPVRQGLLSASTGARYRDAILAQGSQDEEMNLVRKFLGREPSAKASSPRSPASASGPPAARAGAASIPAGSPRSRRACSPPSRHRRRVESAARCHRACLPCARRRSWPGTRWLR